MRNLWAPSQRLARRLAPSAAVRAAGPAHGEASVGLSPGTAAALPLFVSSPHPPWWISGNEELCSSCGLTYAHGGGHRCADCDAELCALCAFLDLDDPFCRECCGEDAKTGGKKSGRKA
jgi:hypothetical protein